MAARDVAGWIVIAAPTVDVAASTVLAADGVVVRAGARAILDGVSLACAAGQVLVVVGENGAGKSTLLDALAGVRAIDAGRVRFVDGDAARTADVDRTGVARRSAEADGAGRGPASAEDARTDVDVHALPPRVRARLIASLSQGDPSSFALSAEARVGQGLAPRRGPHALLDDAARGRVRAVADELGVAALLDRDLGSLSSGERRRVQLARALVDDEARAYVLDEPHAGVDVKHQALVTAAIRRRAARGAIVVVSVHELGVALALADRVVGVRAGAVVVDGPPRDALSSAGVEKVYGVAGARIVDEGGVVGVLLPR